MRRRRNGEGPCRYAAPAALPEDEEFKMNRKKKDSHKSFEEETKVEKEVKKRRFQKILNPSRLFYSWIFTAMSRILFVTLP